MYVKIILSLMISIFIYLIASFLSYQVYATNQSYIGVSVMFLDYFYRNFGLRLLTMVFGAIGVFSLIEKLQRLLQYKKEEIVIAGKVFSFVVYLFVLSVASLLLFVLLTFSLVKGPQLPKDSEELVMSFNFTFGIIGLIYLIFLRKRFHSEKNDKN